ncbi:MAG: hypothetical protein IT555_07930 [Acetobacteraceae bacterium]|nr:hypothetical protein [Acetobacteraceae bacterium]
MNTPATTPTQEHPAQSLAARLNAILTGLAGLLFLHLRVPFIVTLCNRISRARQRLVTLLARLAAGRAPRRRTPRPGQKGGPPSAPIPRGRAWVFRALHDDARHNVAAHAAQLEFLLHDPATAALLAAAPPTALNGLARTLRPLCHLLGVALPAALRPPAPPPASPPRRPRPRPRPRPSTPAPPPETTPYRPLPRYVRLAVRAWKKNPG